MDNLFDYLDNYGNVSFLESPLNEVDLAVLSAISYVDFTGILDNSGTKVALGDAADLYFMSHNKKNINYNIMGVVGGINTFKAARNLRRYRFLKLYNYQYIANKGEQFSVLFVDIDPHLSVVVFEGTDELISGWKEDFEFAYRFPVASDIDAIKCVNEKIHALSTRKYIFTGHSKGGHLALVAGMYLEGAKRFNLKKIVSLDGPGLRVNEYKSHEYRRISRKYEQIIPDHSIVGMLLANTHKPHVIKSTKRGFTAHHLQTWLITENRFTRASLSDFSIGLKKMVDDFISKYDEVTLTNFVEDLFCVFEEAEVETLMDIKSIKIKKIYNCIKAAKNIDDDTRKLIIEFLDDFISLLFDKNND